MCVVCATLQVSVVERWNSSINDSIIHVVLQVSINDWIILYMLPYNCLLLRGETVNHLLHYTCCLTSVCGWEVKLSINDCIIHVVLQLSVVERWNCQSMTVLYMLSYNCLWLRGKTVHQWLYYTCCLTSVCGWEVKLSINGCIIQLIYCCSVFVESIVG